MTNTIKDFHALTVLLNKELITQSELSKKHVFNSLTMYGADLAKTMDDLDVYDSYDLEDSILLFEITDEKKNIDCTFEDDGELYSYASYSCHLIIYGEASNELAHKLKARFESEYVRNKLLDKGVQVYSCSDPRTIHEYINEVMWLRSDMDIPVSVCYKVDEIEEYDYIETANLEQITKA